MIFKLLQISWFIILISFGYSFLKATKNRERWLLLGLIILSFLMMLFLTLLEIRMGKIAAGIMIERAYPVHVQTIPAMPKVQHPVKPVIQTSLEGKSSYYDYKLASGWSSVGHRVCATRDWPRQSNLKVINIKTGAETTCKVTDFGPNKELHPDRIIDLSSFAFSELAPLSRGIIQVKVIKLD